MKHETNGLIHRNSIFAWLALVTGVILLAPLIGMQFTSEIQWDGADFMVMGLLVLGLSSLFILVARKVRRRQRLLIGGVFTAVFLYLWAELAVGVFTNLGS